MKEIKVLGSGCTKCTKVAEAITSVIQSLNADAIVIKETNPKAIMDYGVMTTPAVVIDDKIVHSGSIPQQEKIESWLS
jgi:small redox-active disulfide protein 2